MKQPAIQLQIPEPCYQNWQQMTPVEQGRFCNACAKTVVDFSIMTDQQILDYLSAAAGGICGRVQQSQLQRTLQPVPVPPKTRWWMALLMPLVMGVQRVKAQQQVLQGKVAYPRPEMQVKKGEVAPITKRTAVHISGTVTDSAGKPIPYAVIQLEAPAVTVSAGEDGTYSLRAEVATNNVELTATSLGYSSSRQTMWVKPQMEWNYVLRQEVAELKPVVITAYGTKSGKIVMGGAMAIEKRTILKDTTDYLKKLIAGKPQYFTVSPNPVHRNQQLMLQSTEADSYTVQIVNNSGGVVYVQYFKSAKNVRQYISVQSAWLPGMYYVRVEDGKTKKQYTQKIIIL